MVTTAVDRSNRNFQRERELQTQRGKDWWAERYPNEIHGLGGDCNNPKCDYQLTPQDEADAKVAGGWFICPKCQTSQNVMDQYYNEFGKPQNTQLGFDTPGGATRAGITMREMGQMGEDIVERLGEIPEVGKIIQRLPNYHEPVDFLIGPYAVEVKTLHSESQAYFKLGDKNDRQRMITFAQENNLKPGLIGVRLNFYTDKADLLFRPGFVDTWVTNAQFMHIGTYDFSDLNPFKHPEDVPRATELPQSDSEFPF